MNKSVFFNRAKILLGTFLCFMGSSSIAQGVDSLKVELSEISASIHEIEVDLERWGDSISHVSTSGIYVRDSLQYFEERIQTLNGIHSAEGRHVFSYFFGGGFSTFDYSPSYGKLEKGFGYTTGLDYSHFWHENWGLSLGLSLDYFNSSLKLDGVETSAPFVDGDIDGDGEPDSFNLLTSYENGFREKQSAYLLGIPILAHYRRALSEKITFVGGFGPKVSLAINGQSEVSQGMFVTRGHYPKYGSGTVLPVGPGFGHNEPAHSYKNNLDLGLSLFTDFKFILNSSSAYNFYAAPFFEYQLNSQSGNPLQPLVSYEVESPILAKSVYHSVMQSDVTEDYRRWSAGLKVGMTFDVGKSRNNKRNSAIDLLKMESDRLLIEIDDLENLRRQHLSDSIDAAQRLFDLNKLAKERRAQWVADSISDALRAQELARLAEEQRILDSIQMSEMIGVIMDIRTEQLSDEDLKLLQLPLVFDFGSAELTDNSQKNAQLMAEMLSNYPTLVFQVIGHTCDIGSEQANYIIGLRRAQTIFKEFTKGGVEPDQILTSSKGQTEPLLPNINETNRRRNRRVVVVIEDEVLP